MLSDVKKYADVDGLFMILHLFSFYLLFSFLWQVQFPIFLVRVTLAMIDFCIFSHYLWEVTKSWLMGTNRSLSCRAVCKASRLTSRGKHFATSSSDRSPGQKSCQCRRPWYLGVHPEASLFSQAACSYERNNLQWLPWHQQKDFCRSKDSRHIVSANK